MSTTGKKSWADIDEEDSIAKLSKDVGKVGLETSEEQAEMDLKYLEADIEVQMCDPDSPLYSATSFEELNLPPNLLKGVVDMGYRKPSSIQEKALPLLLKSPPENIIAQAQSGTGKTAAFSLSMLYRVDPSIHSPQVICMCTTRELAIQISQVVERLAKHTGISICQVLAKKRFSKITDQILVGTPGKMKSICAGSTDKRTKRKTPAIVKMENIKLIVLDEADQMVSEHKEDCNMIKDSTTRMRKSKGLPPPQVVCFSATFDESVKPFMMRFVPEPRNQIFVKKKDVTIDRVFQYYVVCQDRYQVLTSLYTYLKVGKCIIFLDVKKDCDALTARLRADDLTVELLHGNMDPSKRDSVMEQFRNNNIRILITTDMLSRGIDVPEVTMVINYDLPCGKGNQADVQSYIHRIGRTGRFGKPGIAINFIHDDKSQQMLEHIRQETMREIKEINQNNLVMVSEELNRLFVKKPKTVNLLDDEDETAEAATQTTATSTATEKATEEATATSTADAN